MERGASGRTVLVMHPAWHQCGSNVLVERQIDAYRSLGHRVVSLAVGTDAGASLANAPYWRHYIEATAGNRADARYHAAHPGETSRKVRLLADWALRRPRSHVAQRGAPAQLAPVPTPLIDELSAGTVSIMHVNHCFCMPLALRIRVQAGRDVPIALETPSVASTRVMSLTPGSSRWTTQRDSPTVWWPASKVVWMRPPGGAPSSVDCSRPGHILKPCAASSNSG